MQETPSGHPPDVSQTHLWRDRCAICTPVSGRHLLHESSQALALPGAHERSQALTSVPKLFIIPSLHCPLPNHPKRSQTLPNPNPPKLSQTLPPGHLHPKPASQACLPACLFACVQSASLPPSLPPCLPSSPPFVLVLCLPRRCESQPVAKDGFTVCESVPVLRLIYLTLCECLERLSVVLESLEEVPEGALKSKGLLRVRVRVRVCARVRIRMRVPVRVRVCVYACVCVACPKTDRFATSNINTNNQ